MKKIFFTFFFVLISTAFLLSDECPTPLTATATVTFKCKGGSDPEGFSVYGTVKGDDTVYVHFAKGNLQYCISKNEWSIMDEQYSIFERIIQEYPGIDYAALDTVSLFGWATSNNPGSGTHYQPWDITPESTYGNLSTPWGGTEFDYDLSDWGKQFGEGWRTLSIEEWDFIFNHRNTRATITWPRTNPYTGDIIEMVTTEHARWAHAEILIDQDHSGEQYIDYDIHGMILIPDDYNGGTPEGVYWDGVNERSPWSTKCTKAGWEALEEAGCIFLPAPGARSGRFVADDGVRGYYWSSSSSTSAHARAVQFNSSYLDTEASYQRYLGYSVRLVKNVE